MLIFRYVCFTGKSENLCRNANFEDISIFVANGHYFEKCLFLLEILSFLKEGSVFEKC